MPARDAGRRVGAARRAWRVSAYPRPEDISAGERLARSTIADLEAQTGWIAPGVLRHVLITTMAAAYAQGRVDERNHVGAPEKVAGEA